MTIPNCFALTKKGEKEPTTLNTIDKELCELLGVEVHPQYYVAGWYNCIGFLIATKDECVLGSQELRNAVEEWFSDGDDNERKEDMLKMLAYLEENYTSAGWYKTKR